MCKYLSNVGIYFGKLIYCPDFVSKIMILAIPFGIFYCFHLDKTQVMYFENLDEDFDVVGLNKLIKFVSVEGFSTLSFLWERGSIWWILLLSFRTGWFGVALSSLIGSFCWFLVNVHQDSKSIPRSSDVNANLEVDVMGRKNWKVIGGIMKQKKPKSLQYVKLVVKISIFAL